MIEQGSIILKGYVILVILQAVLWLVQTRTKDASTADVGWSIGMSVLVAWYGIQLPGLILRKWMLFIPVFIWSLRLSSHLIRRIMNDKNEDSRYDWGRDAARNFFFIYQLQPVFNVLLSVPFFIVFLNTAKTIKGVEIIALLLWVIGLLGETLADEQLRHFKSNPANKGKICQQGLWSLSRHPNFFFEWVMWVAYFIFALGSPYGWLAIIAPAFMLFLLMKVTGIPIMEQRALKMKGEAFREYMRTTSFFIPMPPKGTRII